MSNDHGWRTLGNVIGCSGGEAPNVRYVGMHMQVGRGVDRLTCACPKQCLRVATQEDLLCDECRSSCPVALTKETMTE